MKNIMLNKLNEKEVGYIFGLFKGDGYIYYDKKNRHYTVDFYLNSIKDSDIIQFLLKLLKKIDCNPITHHDNRYNCIRIRVKSKKFFDFLIKNKLNYNKNFILGFISGLIDSDGYINHKKMIIEIINTDKNLLLRAKRMLSILEIKSSIRKRVMSRKDKKASFRLLITFKFIDIDNISLKVSRSKTPVFSGD